MNSAVVLPEINRIITTAEQDCSTEENDMEQCQHHKNLSDHAITYQVVLLDKRITGLCLYLFIYLTFSVRSYLVDQQKELPLCGKSSSGNC